MIFRAKLAKIAKQCQRKLGGLYLFAVNHCVSQQALAETGRASMTIATQPTLTGGLKDAPLYLGDGNYFL